MLPVCKLTTPSELFMAHYRWSGVMCWLKTLKHGLTTWQQQRLLYTNRAFLKGKICIGIGLQLPAIAPTQLNSGRYSENPRVRTFTY